MITQLLVKKLFSLSNFGTGLFPVCIKLAQNAQGVLGGFEHPPLDPKEFYVFVFSLASLSEKLVMYEDTPTPCLET